MCMYKVEILASDGDEQIIVIVCGCSAIGRWTCDLQVAGSIPSQRLSRNIGQLSLASLRGR